MSWCERKLKELNTKGEENWTEDDLETYYYCVSTLNSEENEAAYLNGEL